MQMTPTTHANRLLKSMQQKREIIRTIFLTGTEKSRKKKDIRWKGKLRSVKPSLFLSKLNRNSI